MPVARTLPLLLAAGAAAAALSGCKRSSAPAAAALGAPRACAPVAPRFSPSLVAGGLCKAYALAACDKKAQCCSVPPEAYDVCVTLEQGSCARDRLEERLGAGMLKIDLAALGACLAAEAALDCDDADARSCLRIPGAIAPGAAPGAACRELSDCTDGFCERAPGACEGACRPRRDPGQPCVVDRGDCDPSRSFCAPSSAESTTGVCQVFVPEGGECHSAVACGPGARCEGLLEREKPTCARLPPAPPRAPERSVAPGGPCRASVECRSGSFCEPATKGDPSGRCQEKLRPGSPCTGTGQCEPSSACRRGRCVARRGLGEECATDPDCARGLVCRERACRALATVGQACARDSECAWMLRCRDGKCDATPGASGDPCGPRHPCQAGLRCIEDRVCGPLARDGELCSRDDDCASLRCTGETTRTCAPPCPAAAAKP